LRIEKRTPIAANHTYLLQRLYNSNFQSVFNRFKDIARLVCEDPISHYHSPIPAKIWGVHLWTDILPCL